MKPGDTVRINSKYGMPVHATVLRIRGRKARVHDRLGGKYWIAMAALTLLSGCCLTGDSWHENVYVPVMSGAQWDGWATTREMTP